MQVNALGPVPVKGLAEPVEVFELVGASAVRRRLQAAVARGLTPLCRAAARSSRRCSRRWSGPGRGMARWWRWWARPGVGKSRLVYEFVHSHHTPGLAGAGERLGVLRQGHALLPGASTCSSATVHVEDRDDVAHHPRQGDRAGADARRGPPGHDPGAAGAAGRPARGQPVPARSIRRSGASARSTRSSACCCAKARCSRCCWSSRICTGSIPRRRRCSTAWSRACRPPGSCCWSTTARSTSTAGAARPTTRNCGSTRCPRRAPTSCLQALLGDDPSLAPLTQLLIARTEGNPFFLEESVRTLVETGVLVGEPGAYRLAQALPTHSGAGHGAGGAGGAHRPAAAGGEAAPADRRGHRHRGALAAAAGHCRAARGRRCTAASRTSRRPSSSTRRASSPSASTPSSTP